MAQITDTNKEVIDSADNINYYPKYVMNTTNTQHLVASTGLMKLDRVAEATSEMVVQAIDNTFIDELEKYGKDPKYKDSKYFIVLIM